MSSTTDSEGRFHAFNSVKTHNYILQSVEKIGLTIFFTWTYTKFERFRMAHMLAETSWNVLPEGVRNKTNHYSD